MKKKRIFCFGFGLSLGFLPLPPFRLGVCVSTAIFTLIIFGGRSRRVDEDVSSTR